MDNFRIPVDLTLKQPENSSLPEDKQHFLVYIPWEDSYLNLVPVDFRDFFSSVLKYLGVRTTDVHTAVCLSYLDEFISKASLSGHHVNRKVLALSLVLHDIGWSQMSESEIAASLGVSGLALTSEAINPKKKHAVLGEKLARKILLKQQSGLNISSKEIELICLSVLYHDKPEEVSKIEGEFLIETQLLVDLDHIWSFTQLNFWQDTIRKGVAPKDYLANLSKDLDSYFVTDIGKEKARELLSEREKEVLLVK